jgi:Flp pilus assembly protein TadG
MKRTHGQALIEFALVSPILLLLIMGIFDFSRLFITFAVTSNSLRSALRQAEVRGVEVNGVVASPGYLNCTTMRAMAGNVLFAQPPTIDIRYQKADTPLASPTVYTCTDATMLPNNVENGDLLRINVQATVNFITPLISSMWPSISINLEGQRTIVSQIQLGAAANVADDSDFDGLNDAWEIRWFGDLDQSATDDSDGDLCNNGCEETRNTDPFVRDTDGDGTEDGQEAGCDLDPNNSSALDADGDGLDANLECVLGLSDTIPDYDGDGLLDGYEHSTSRTNPALPDSDADGISDGLEVLTYHSNPRARDTDRDGLWDASEIARGTNITAADTDSDGLLDGEEAGFSDGSYGGTGTNALVADTDGDHLTDGYELLINDSDPRVMDGDDTNPMRADTDGDGLTDDLELLIFHTNPRAADSDGDTLTDFQEVNGTATNPACVPPQLAPTDPWVQDTDNDGTLDPDDCESGYDTDRDGLLDGWEFRYFPGNLLALEMPADLDGDGCDNFCEQTFGTDPTQPDTDLDGLLDGLETVQAWTYSYPRTNPLNGDTDGDGIKDGDEIANNIDPWNRDTDSDGLTDGQELLAGRYNGLGTAPSNPDSDNDGLRDGEEVNFASRGYTVTVGGTTTPVTGALNPLSNDSDGDHLTDGEEVLFWRTNPLVPDTDADGLSDGDEVRNSDTDALIMDIDDTHPLLADTDGDSLSDGAERNTYATNPRSTDSDGDRLTDAFEVNFTTISVRVNGTTSNIACTLDPNVPDKDGDGANDGSEVNRAGGATNPCNPDTDGDQLCDGASPTAAVLASTCALGGEPNRGLSYTVNENITSSVTISTDPLRTDTDADGVGDKLEIDGTRLVGGVVAITDPTLVDSDADGVNDSRDAYPNNQPTIEVVCMPAGCTTTEPGSGTTNHGFRVFAAYVNSGQPVPVRYTMTDGTAISAPDPASGQPAACSTGAAWDYRRLIPDQNDITISGSGSPGFSTVNIQICRDNITLSGPPWIPRTNEALSETFTVEFAPQATDQVFVRPAGLPATFTVTISNR